jgi:cell shape-determining protein MreD
MKRAILAVLAVIIFVLQLSFIPALRPFGVVPNLGIALIALVGLYGTASLSLTMAIIGGLALDLASGSDFGLYVGLFVLVGLVAGYIYRAGFDSAAVLAGLVLVIGATLAESAVVLGGLLHAATGWPLGTLAREIGVELALNTGIFIMLNPIIHWLLPDDTSAVMEIRS